MRLLFTSDLHGLIPAFKRFAQLLRQDEYDLGIISGDLTTGFRSDELEKIKDEQDRIGGDFLEELHSPDATIPIEPDELLVRASRQKEIELKNILEEARKPVFSIMGNDDGIVGNGWESTKLLKNINQRREERGYHNFVGYQYTNPFVGGPFEKTEREQLKDFRQLKKLIDRNTVLVTHGPAYGFLKKGNSTQDSTSIGSKALRRFLDRVKPKLHLFGHVHYWFGIYGNEIDGAYPRFRKYVSVDLDSNNIDFVE